MSKRATFTKSDEKLIKQIETYQHAHGLSSFIAAVRDLCQCALDLKRITK